MKQAQHRLSVQTDGPGLYEVTDEVAAWLSNQEVRTGLLTVFVRHTSASLVIQENADPDVQTDLHSFFERLVVEDPRLYRHSNEGPDDMPAHVKSALTQTQLSIPVQDRRMVLGTWQGIFAFEHKRAPSMRELVLHILGE